MTIGNVQLIPYPRGLQQNKRWEWKSNLCPSASTGSQVQLNTPRLPRLTYPGCKSMIKINLFQLKSLKRSASMKLLRIVILVIFVLSVTLKIVDVWFQSFKYYYLYQLKAKKTEWQYYYSRLSKASLQVYPELIFFCDGWHEHWTF